MKSENNKYITEDNVFGLELKDLILESDIKSDLEDTKENITFIISKQFGILRESPNHITNQIAKIKLDKEIVAMDIVKGSFVSNSDLWIKCEYNNMIGYIHTSYCTELHNSV